MPPFLFFLLFFAAIVVAHAQPPKIPLMRQAFHDKVNDLQKRLLKMDGTGGNTLNMTDDDDINLQLTYTATKRIDAIENSIESDTDNSNSKIKYLRALAETLEGFFTGYRRQTMRITQLPTLVNAFGEGMRLDKQKLSIVSFIANQPFEIDDILLRSVLFEDNAEYQPAKNIVFLKDCKLHPRKDFTLFKCEFQLSVCR